MLYSRKAADAEDTAKRQRITRKQEVVIAGAEERLVGSGTSALYLWSHERGVQGSRVDLQGENKYYTFNTKYIYSKIQNLFIFNIQKKFNAIYIYIYTQPLFMIHLFYYRTKPLIESVYTNILKLFSF